MEDRTLVCQDCGKDFVFTVGEQEFYKEKGFDNEPKDVRNAETRKRTNVDSSETTDNLQRISHTKHR